MIGRAGAPGGLASKPRSKELSRLSSEPGMKGGHPEGVSWGREQGGSQGSPGRAEAWPKAKHLSTDFWRSIPHPCVQGAESRGSSLTAHLLKGSLDYTTLPTKLVNTCYTGLERTKLRV